jgi:hypothetical protein
MKYIKLFSSIEKKQEFEQTINYWPIIAVTTNGYEIESVPNYYGEDDVVITPTSKPKINFIVNGITYEAENGMTWEDWVNSEYNTGTFSIGGNYIYGATFTHTIVYNRATYQDVNKNDTIISGGTYAYTIDSPNHGGGAN